MVAQDLTVGFSTRLTDTASVDVFTSVVQAYRDREFERGYERALRDLLVSLIPLTEQYLRAADQQTVDPRRLVYGYVEFLERHLNRGGGEVGYVEAGLGI